MTVKLHRCKKRNFPDGAETRHAYRCYLYDPPLPSSPNLTTFVEVYLPGASDFSPRNRVREVNQTSLISETLAITGSERGYELSL